MGKLKSTQTQLLAVHTQQLKTTIEKFRFMSPNDEWNQDKDIDELKVNPIEHPSLSGQGGELEVGRFELDTLADLFETQTSRPKDSENGEETGEQMGDNSTDPITLALEEDFDELLKKSSLPKDQGELSPAKEAEILTNQENLTDVATEPVFFSPEEDDFSDLLSVPDSSGGLDPSDATLSSDLGDLFGHDFSFEDGKKDPTYPTHPGLEYSPAEELGEWLKAEQDLTADTLEFDYPDGVTSHTNPLDTTPMLQEKQNREDDSDLNLDELISSLEADSENTNAISDADDFQSLFDGSNQTSEPINLDNLLASLEASEPEKSPSPTSSSIPTPSPSDTSSTNQSQCQNIHLEQLEYFAKFEDLEALIDEPVGNTKTPIQAQVNFGELEALIDQPVAALLEQNSTVSLSNNPSTTTTLANQGKDSEDEFEDLEELLSEIHHEVGSQSNGKNTSKQNRLGSRRTHQVRVFEQTLKVPVKQLDNLSNLVGELVVNRNGLEQDQEQLRQSLDNLLQHVVHLSDLGARMQDFYERTLLERSLLASRRSYEQSNLNNSYNSNNDPDDDDYDPLEMDSFTGFHLISQEMIEMIVRVKESASDIGLLVDESDQVTRNLRQTTSKLQEGIKTARMVPFARTADRLPVAVRRISQKLNKQAEVQIEGRDTLIDKMILEHLSDPMTHLVNNALYHGIESPEERQARGKSPVGQITISAYYQGNQTVITVADDGGGIPPDKVKAKAINKGLITPDQAKVISEVEVYDLLFHPGFSIKDQADDFAGRGVGMDVVRTSIREIRGTVSIDSSLGTGTTFTIRLPLTLSICPALFCLSDRARIAFPMDGVEDTQDYPSDQVQTNEQGECCISWRDTVLTVKPLPDLLSYNRQIGRGIVYGGKQEEDIISIVVLRSGGNFLAVQVDQVLEQQEIVIKQLNSGPVPSPPGIAGATILGDGSIMAIADVLELLEIAQGRMRKDSNTNLWETMTQAKATEDNTCSEPMVLIVDDSITVRELLKTTFSNAGYRVEQARDGQEAWEKLRSGLPCDIVFCDIEMPRMDGLELLERMNKDEQLGQIPIAMLTSRGAERHKNVAAERGASGYFTKPYTEKELLDAAQRMMSGEVLLSNSSRLAQATLTSIPSSKPTPEREDSSESRVLIVDDSVTVRQLLTITFEGEGYLVEQARDGQEAWEKLHTEKDYDLVLCDIEMPRMDGLTLLSEIQQEQSLNQVPVAMLTSRGAKKHRQIAAQRGAKAYFTKPYTEKELLEASQRLIQGEVLLEDE